MLWLCLHIGTIAIPSCAFFWGAKALDVLIPTFTNLVVNFAPSLMLKIIKRKLDLAKGYADAAAETAKLKGADTTEIKAEEDRARSKHENEQEIVGHLCITFISIFGLLATATVLNFAFMFPPAVTVGASSITTNSVSPIPQSQSPNTQAHPVRRGVGITVNALAIVFSIVLLLHVATFAEHFIGKERYIRQDTADYLTWVSPPSIRCPMTYYRLVMTILNSTLPLVKYWMN